MWDDSFRRRLQHHLGSGLWSLVPHHFGGHAKKVVGNGGWGFTALMLPAPFRNCSTVEKKVLQFLAKYAKNICISKSV